MAYDSHAEYQAPQRQYMDQGPQQRPPSNQRQNGYSLQAQGDYGYNDYGYQQEYGQQAYSPGAQQGNRGPRPPPQQLYQQDDFGYGDLIGGYDEHSQQSRGPRGPPRGAQGQPRPRQDRSYGYDEGHGGQEYGHEQSRRPPPGPRQNSGGPRPPMRGRPPQGYPPQNMGRGGRPPPQQRPDPRGSSGQGRSRPPQNYDGRPPSDQAGHKAPTRDRMMKQQQRPMAMSQDNAFPTFGSNNSAKGIPAAELDNPMAKLNVNGVRNSEDRARPPTSASHKSNGSTRGQAPNGFHDSGYQESFEPPFAQERPGYASKDSFNSRPSYDSSRDTRSSQRKSPPKLPPLNLGSSQVDRVSGSSHHLAPSYSSFGPISRAATMPNHPAEESRLSQPQQWARAPTDSYQGPTSQSYVARPNTSSGTGQSWNTRPSTQDTQVYKAFTSPKYESQDPLDLNHKRDESLSDLYDDYAYDDDDPQKHVDVNNREEAIELDMPNFDALPAASSPRLTLHFNSPTFNAQASPDLPEVFDERNGFYKQAKMSRSQPDLRLQAREEGYHQHNGSDVPPMPRQHMTPAPAGRGMGYGRGQGPRGPPGATGYGMHRPEFDRNIPNQSQWSDPGPRPSMDSQQRPSLQMDRPRNSNSDALPSHPVPVRPGLNDSTSPSNGNQGPHRPPPVRQYDDPAAVKNSMDRRSSIPVTHDELNRLRSIVQTNPNDRKSQLLLAKKLVEAARVLADEGGSVDIKTRNKNREKFITEAHKNVKKLVSLGYPEGMFYMADSYGMGQLGLEVDTKEAFNLYQAAAKMGHAQSAYRTAVCCEMGAEEGGGTRKDPQKAVQWYKRAAALGDVAAMYKVGMVSMKGLLGHPKNLGEAVNWLKRAAECADVENPHALHELGLLYEGAATNTSGPILRDENHAFQLFNQAAGLGYKFSQFRLGQAYEYGQLGLPIDSRNSIAWYTRAASQGEHQSELALSGWYLTGSAGLIEQSDTEAYLWARKASTADPPLPKAMFAMGYFTEVGIGCPRSLEEAKKWYGRAAAYKFPKAQERLEELKKGGMKAQKNRERLSRTDKKQQDENCVVM